MVTLNKIYTRTGDDGTTGLVGGGRISKGSAKVNAYGDIDELNAQLAVCSAECEGTSCLELKEVFTTIQNELFDIGAELAAPPHSSKDTPYAVTNHHVARLEKWIDSYNESLPTLSSFVLPGGSKLNAQLHVARTVCRRAERAITLLMEQESVSADLFQYVNRLSDLLFVLSRHALHTSNTPEHLWVPGASRPSS
jgi:cob(I)alamin adenosyltransferase